MRRPVPDIKSSVTSIGVALAICASSLATRPVLAAPPLPVVQHFDLERYVGQWHEIARYPNFFERMCVGDVTATYALNLGGTLSVVNTCRKDDGSMVRAEGLARIVAPAKLKVRFAPSWLRFFPFVWGDYWVIDLAPGFTYAVVGDPSRDYLWILARDLRMDDATYARITAGLAAVGYDAAKLLRNPTPER